MGGDSACRGGSLSRYDPTSEATRGTARQVRREGLRLLVERLAVLVLLVRRGGLRAGAGAVALGAWVVLHDLCTRVVVRLGLERLVCCVFHFLKDRRVDGHGAVAVGRE